METSVLTCPVSPGGNIMNIGKKINGNHITLYPNGRITAENTKDLAEVFDSLDYSSLSLTVDFSAVDYITSAGLRTLLVPMKRLASDHIEFTNVSDTVKLIFDTTGFSSMVSVSQKGTVASGSQFAFMSVKSCLSRLVKEHGGKKVFYFGEKSYTWNDVDRYSYLIAGILSKSGVGKGTHVGILARNSINWIYAFFAINRLGGIVVLLNATLKPDDVVRYSEIGDITHLCLGDVSSKTSKEEYLAAIECSSCSIEHVLDISSGADFSSCIMLEEFSEPEVDADDPNLMIFTSGTTGRPKGVISSFRDRLVNSGMVSERMRITPEDIICQYLPLCHIFGYGTGLVVSIMYNIPIHFVGSGDNYSIAETIRNNHCTVFNSVPTKLISMANDASVPAEQLKSLRVSIVSGAAITASQMQLLHSRMPGTHFLCLYGMSEISPISMVEYDDTIEHLTKTVGHPTRNVIVEIRDSETGQKCPPGISGEVLVRSDTSMICYYKLDLSEQALDPDGWIRTGDLGILREDGYLQIVGRAKDIIIRGGENISPNEVASVLTKLEFIEDCRVVGVPDELYGEIVAAAVILKNGCVFDEEAVNSYFLSKLAKFKIPEYYVFYDAFPLLPSGKADMLRIKKEITEKRPK